MTITPFRYPGAKNKMLGALDPYIEKSINDTNSKCFCDIFVGGGSVLLHVASKWDKINLYANDKDYLMYCFWKTICDTDLSKLDSLFALMAAPVTLELFYKLRSDVDDSEVASAYKAIFFNRTAFSGILSSGPIGGKEQKSKYTVDCRYNFDKLKKKMLLCNKLLAGRTQVENKDFSDCLNQFNDDVTIYCDPPYFAKGAALYPEHMKAAEHTALAGLLNKKKNWILSYDDCSEIRELYKENTIIDLSARYCINGKKENWESKNELIILP